MKKTVILGIVAILIFSGLGAVALPETEHKTLEKLESISFSNVQIKDMDDHIIVHLDEATSYLMKAGNYFLPAVTRVFTFPFGTKINDVVVSFSGIKEKTVSKKVSLVPEPIPDIYNERTASEFVEKDNEVYPLGIYPTKQYSYNVGAGRDGDKLVNYLSVKLCPVQYDSSENKVYYANNADIKITYTLPDNPVVFADDYDLVIIAPEKFANALQPLVDHKNSRNITTKLVTLKEIYTSVYFPVEGRDCAEEVKYFIKNAFDEWGIKYALLIGGRKGGVLEEKWWVPVRYSHLDDGGEGTFLTDLYFSDIYDGEGNFSSWDSNENGIFGEWVGMTKDILDMYPDVYVGRLACINLLDVRMMVNKIIKYENTAYGTEWVKRFVGVAGDTYPAPGDPYYEGELATEAAFEFINESGFEATYLWTSTGTFADKQDIIDGVSEGCGFLHFSGHGSLFSWANHPPHNESWVPGPTAFDMLKLSNGEKQPIVLVGGCHNAQYNTSLTNILKGILEEGLLKYFSTEPPIGSFWRRAWIPKCWALSMHNRLNKGCIAIMANSGFGYGISGEGCLEGRGRFMEIMFFRSYSEGKDMLGETHSTELTYFLDEFPPMDNKIDCKIVQQWVLLGDPSLKIGGYSE